MGTILASKIVDDARKLLNDSGVRWTDAEVLSWLNAGQREVALYRPDAYVVTEGKTLASGTKQSIPATANRLLDVIRNLGPDGATPGRSVRLIDREVLDAQIPDWHTASASTTIQHFCYDNRNPKLFYVYPPAQSGYWVEIAYSATPPDVPALGNAISIDDMYANILVDYILYRAYLKNVTYGGNPNMATAHYTAFVNALTGKTEVDVRASPNANAPPYNPLSAGGIK